jgi:hypothetical protein
MSSEIMQLSPDAVANHPDAEMLRFVVTSANGRRNKVPARRRLRAGASGID